MGIKISELPAASALAGTEPLPLVQATETRKATVSDIAPVRSVAGKTGAVILTATDCGAAATAHTHTGTYEPALGNPASDGLVLSSTAAGVRSWVDGGGSPGLVLLATATASNVTSVDFTSGIDSTYDEYEVHLINITPETINSYLWMRTSTDGGSTFDSGGFNYIYSQMYAIYNGTITKYGDGSTRVLLSPTGIDNTSGNRPGYSGKISIFSPSNGLYKNGLFCGTYNFGETTYGMWSRFSANDINAIRFLFSSGNISSGEFKLYGLKKSL